MMGGSLDVARMTKPVQPLHLSVQSSGQPSGHLRLATPRLGTSRPRPPLSTLALAAVALTAAACDGAAPALDASTPPSARTSAVSLRIDVPADKPPTLTVLAFRAAFLGVPASEVLGIVDPLAAAAPAQDCQLRDVDRAVAALVDQGQAIELEELTGVGISVGDANADVRPSPRLYPDVAATVGGVVAEAGPLGLVAVPQRLRVTSNSAGLPPGASPTASSDTTALVVPTAGWATLLNGTIPHDGSRIEVAGDLNLKLAVGDGAATSVELRPLGATVALSCRVSPAAAPTGGEIALVVTRQFLAALAAASGATPGTPVTTALDLVRRVSGRLPLSDTQVSLEVRTSTLVELQP